MTETVCPNCGYNLDTPDSEPEERGPAAQCADCGGDIEYEETHLLRVSDCPRVPDATTSRIVAGNPDGERVCVDCSDQPLGEF